MNHEQLKELLEMYPHVLKMDGYDDCIIGLCERFGMQTVLAYDKTKIIDKMINDDNMTHEEAEEFFYFNQIGAWMGEMTPVFVTVCID